MDIGFAMHEDTAEAKVRFKQSESAFSLNGVAYAQINAAQSGDVALSHRTLVGFLGFTT